MLGSYYYVPVLFLSSSLCTYYWQLWGVRYDGLGHVWLSKAGLVLSSLSHFAEILFLKTWSLTHINSQLMFSSLYQNPVHNTPIATLTAYVFASRSATTFTVLKSTSFFFFTLIWSPYLCLDSSETLWKTELFFPHSLLCHVFGFGFSLSCSFSQVPLLVFWKIKITCPSWICILLM